MCFWEHLADCLDDASDPRAWMRCPFGWICAHYYFNINRMRQCMKSWLQHPGWQNAHLLSVCLGFFPSMSWLPWLLFILSMLQWAVQGKEKASKQTPCNLGCHPAVILRGSWGNVTLECSRTLTVNWGPETSPGVCSVTAHPQSSVSLTSLLPPPL